MISNYFLFCTSYTADIRIKHNLHSYQAILSYENARQNRKPKCKLYFPEQTGLNHMNKISDSIFCVSILSVTYTLFFRSSLILVLINPYF